MKKHLIRRTIRMKNLRFTLTLAFLGLFIAFLGPNGAMAQQTENPKLEPLQKFPVFEAEKVGTINFANSTVEDWSVTVRNTKKVIHAPGLDLEKEQYDKIKKQVNEARAEAEKEGKNGPKMASQKTAGGGPPAPTMGASFYANYFDGIPNDNHVAYGNGSVCSVTNSRIFNFSETGTSLGLSKGFTSFYGGAGLKFDPKIVFDPDHDRFVFVWLNGDGSATSKIVVCFSETDNPQGNWNVYALPGNANPGVFGATWVDFPLIALSQDELFIATNLYSDAGQYVGGYIYQVEKMDGYNALPSLTSQGWGAAGTGVFTMHPAQGGSQLYGPKMWFVSTVNSPFGSANLIKLHEITNTIASGTAQWNSYQVTSTHPYGLAPDADQPGTSINLDARDCRVRDAYFENDRVHFSFNVNVNNKVAAYIGTVTGLANPLFAGATGNWVSNDSLDVGYPSVKFGGCTSQAGENSHFVFADLTGANFYPGNGVFYIDTLGNISDLTVLKQGFSYTRRSTEVPERWGDYTGIGVDYDCPGRAFGAGYYAFSATQHYNATWVSEFFSPCYSPCLVGIDEPELKQPEMTVYPNPTIDKITINFPVAVTGMYDIWVLNTEGKKIKQLMYDRLTQGEVMLSFNTEYLSNGIYMVVISNTEGPVFSEKIIVNK